MVFVNGIEKRDGDEKGKDEEEGIEIEIHGNEDPPLLRVEATPLDSFLIIA